MHLQTSATAAVVGDTRRFSGYTYYRHSVKDSNEFLRYYCRHELSYTIPIERVESWQPQKISFEPKEVHTS